MNLSELLAYQSRKYPKKEGIVTPKECLTYAEWNDQVNQLARALTRLGIQAGDKVMIHMPNTKEFVVSYFAIHRLGAVVVPVNARLVRSEVSYIYDHSDAVALLTDEGLIDQVRGLADEKVGVFIKTGSAEGVWHSFSELLDKEDPIEIVNEAHEDEEASILYTSGTTGQPKGVVFTHKNIWTVSSMMAVELEMKPSSRMLHMMPFSHSAPLHLFLAGGTFVGATHIIAPTFTPDLLLHLASTERATHFFGAPVAYLLTAKHPKVKETDLSWMKYWTYGGAPLSKNEVQFVREQLGTDSLCCLYGLTEAGPSGTLLLPQDHEEKAGSVGKRAALHCEFRIVNEDGQEVEEGEVGEIALKGEGIMKGYHKDGQKTSAVLRDGWLLTGDMGKLDEDGFLWVIDRKKDLIISGGVNIYPREVETILLKHPHIEDVAVVGVPHPDWGETVKAHIVQTGQMADLETECPNFLKEHLADYKIPKLYEERVELPRNATGKLLKHRLREQAKQV
ncbi:long-chain acyl-CoA synthetase/feruloyl-CoA synthase [Halobacillus karajensis]|uniref:class I adenylate-forming enzyme family protein n=1 Tax=Halobacillus karajensis TaxID=195088 RepID=UPI0008A74F04|nr:long-chain-fatty-acid--CoA ligase [Halobacillus karajensis]SEH39391.1 long-chain acyl-CoA synthetase/feruloyl-CoA synthase [Halobacillus karajensis]